MLRPVELLALLYGSDLEVSPADEDVYVRAFPRPVTQTSSRISLHSLFGERLWPDFHRLEHCRYGLRTLLVNSGYGLTKPSCPLSRQAVLTYGTGLNQQSHHFLYSGGEFA